jgi:hypothetical protein
VLALIYAHIHIDRDELGLGLGLGLRVTQGFTWGAQMGARGGLSDRDPDAFLFFFAVNARAALEKLPLESPSSMLILGGSLVYSRTITKRPGLNRTGTEGSPSTGRRTC